MSDPNPPEVPLEKRRNFIHDASDQGKRVLDPAKDVRDAFWTAEDNFASIERPTPTYEPENGADFANGESGALDAPGNGAAAAGFSEPIELVHFGFIYKEGRERFVAAQSPATLDDTSSYRDVPDNIRAIQYRAALQREAILLAGFLRSTKLAIKYRYDPSNSKKAQGDGADGGFGALAGALSGVSDLVGGGTGSKSIIAEDELTPMVSELARIAPTINEQTVDYVKLYQAGCDLHVLRKTYGKWMGKAITRLDSKPADKGMLGAAADSLNPLGIGGPIASFAAVLGPFVALAQKWSTVTTDAYFHMALEYSIAMHEPIVIAARRMSEDALRRRAMPTFSVWTKPPPPPEDPNAPPAPKNNLLDDAKDAINDVGNFLKRPIPRCPGTPFLDIAFQEVDKDARPDHVNNDPHTRTGLEVRSVVLPELSARLVSQALGKRGIHPDSLGAFGRYLCDVIVEGSRVVADFLHAVYGVTTTLTAAEGIDKEHMLAAGRTHLVNKLIYVALDKFKVLNPIRQTAPTYNSKAVIDPEALMGEGLARLESLLEPALKAIDPILAFAMYELADDLTEARAWCGSTPSFTVEAYLAILPATYAKLVRHLVFFLVDKILELFTTNVLNPALKAVGLPGVSNDPKNSGSLGAAGALAGGPLGAVTKNLGAAGDLVEKASKVIRDAQALGNAIGKGLERAKQIAEQGYGHGHNKDAEDSFNAGIDDIKNAKGEDESKPRKDKAAPADTPPGDGYPFASRITLGVGKPITDGDITAAKAIAAKHKIAWRDTTDNATTSTGAAR